MKRLIVGLVTLLLTANLAAAVECNCGTFCAQVPQCGACAPAVGDACTAKPHPVVQPVPPTVSK